MAQQKSKQDGEMKDDVKTSLKHHKIKHHKIKHHKIKQHEITIGKLQVSIESHTILQDDWMYKRHHDLWEAIPRGFHIFRQQVSDFPVNITREKLPLGNQPGETLQGLRKFGYEDDVQYVSEGTNISQATHVIALAKENGRNFQITSFGLEGQRFLAIGSKTVSIVVREDYFMEDLLTEQYDAFRFNIAKENAILYFDTVVKINPKYKAFHVFLQRHQFTAVGEAIVKNEEHLVDYNGWQGIRFFVLTKNQPSSFGLARLFNGWQDFGLASAKTSSKMILRSDGHLAFRNQVLAEENSEGIVEYWFKDNDGVKGGSGVEKIDDLKEDSWQRHITQDFNSQKVIFICKFKAAANYVLERVAREKILSNKSKEDIIKACQSRLKDNDFNSPICQELGQKWLNSRLVTLTGIFHPWLQYKFPDYFIKKASREERWAIQSRWISLQKECVSEQ